MIKTVVAATLALTSMVAITLPSQAAESINACDASYSVADNEASIMQRLEANGVAVSSVEDWNGCVRAFIVKADGTQGMAFYDPLTLEQVAINA